MIASFPGAELWIAQNPATIQHAHQKERPKIAVIEVGSSGTRAQCCCLSSSQPGSPCREGSHRRQLLARLAISRLREQRHIQSLQFMLVNAVESRNLQ